MPDWNTVARHLRQLKVYIGRLHELQQHTRQDVLTNWQVQAMVDRYLQLGVEVIISIAEQLIAILDLPIPDSSREAMQALVDAGILSMELGSELRRAVGFRNVIVHGYLDIDYDIVYDVLQSDVTHLEQFVIHIATFVEKQMSSNSRSRRA